MSSPPLYLPGATPYAPELVQQFVASGDWENLTYADVLARSVALFPKKLAIIDDRARLTYEQLQERVDRLAIALLELGLKKNDRVLLQLPNRVECVVAFFAMQRIGVVPVPAVTRNEYLEVSHFLRLMTPVAWMIPLTDGFRDFRPLIERVSSEASSLKHLIVLDDGLGPRAEPLPKEQGTALSPFKIELGTADSALGTGHSAPGAQLPHGALSLERLIRQVDLTRYPADYLDQFRPDPNDVAIIFTTGGTTGTPKGVPRTHNSFLCNVRRTAAKLQPDDVTALSTPIGHTRAYQGPVSCSVYVGASLVLIGVPRAKAILEAIQLDRISYITLVPTQLEDVLNIPDLDRYDLSSLRMVMAIGDALRPQTAKKALEFFTSQGIEFRGGGFGCTEGPGASHVPGEPPDVFERSVGRPAEGDHWKVVDDDERELPMNAEGELVATGPAVFTGYFRSEEQNRHIFTHDGYFKLGDLGKIDEQGYVYITGRKKDVIQRGGEGVVPGEIEALLDRHPDVEASAVVAMPDQRLGEKACAYVVPKSGRTLDLENVNRFLRGLGAGMLLRPERLEIVDALPRTSVGKIDKRALRKDIEEKLKREESLIPEEKGRRNG